MASVQRPAPDFQTTAFADGGYKKVQLTDYRGRWVVLFFYPGDYTFVCPTELTDLATRYQELRSLGVEVLAVSTDSHHVHRAWQEAELSKMVPGGLPFPMLADPQGRIGSLFGVYDEEAGVDLRGSFIIDPDGVLQAAEIVAPSVGRSSSELIRRILAFQHARETGEVLPCGWTPGQVTLKPGAELVGRVWEVWKPQK
jgi:peroxiredoxin (alkyl hydroperoxide reductase subunit C)